MKLNLFSILEYLKLPSHVLYCRDKAAFDISGVAVCANDCPAEPDILYLADSSLLADLIQLPIHLIVLGKNPNCKFDIGLKSLTFIQHENIQILAEELRQAIHYFCQWKLDIQEYILSRKPFQEVFDLCASILRNPLALFDAQQTLLLWAGTIPETNETSLWNFVLEHGYSPKEEAADDVSELLKKNDKPFYFSSHNRYKGDQRLIARVVRNNVFFGCLALTDISVPFTDGEYANVCMIQKLINYAVVYAREFTQAADNTPWFILQLIKGEQVNPSVVAYNISRYGLELESDYFLWVFNCTATKDMGKIKEQIANISYLLQTEMVYYYADQIVVVDSNLNHLDTEYSEKISKILFQNHLLCGRSMIFSNILDLHQAFMQAIIATGFSKKQEITDFKNVSTAYLLRCVKNDQDSNGFFYPGIQKLLDYDPIYGKELVGCLQAYLMSGMNVSATAKKLYIHRHTMLYRLDCIQNIIQADFKNMSEDEILLLYLSCRALIE